MSNLRAAAQQALTILEAWKHKGMWGDWDGITDALRAALAEPVPDSKYATIAEWWADKQCPNCASLQDQNAELDRKLAEMERKPLDDLAIADIYTKWDATPGTSMADFARAIESAHGIKDA